MGCAARPCCLVLTLTRPARCRCAAATSDLLPDKAWLPPDWRNRLHVSETSGERAKRNRDDDYTKGIFGTGFFAGVLFCSCIALTTCSIAHVLRKRRRSQLGGAPIAPTITRVGDVASTTAAAPGGYTAPVVTPTSCASAPLVLSDSAQASTFHADVATPVGSRV